MPRIRRKLFGKNRKEDPESQPESQPEDQLQASQDGKPAAEEAGAQGQAVGPDPGSDQIDQGWTDLDWLNRPAADSGNSRVAVPPEELDPDGEMMADPHRHEAYWTGARKLGGRTEICYCGAYRDVGLVKAGNWAGGEPTGTPWERAHLQAVRFAVEQTPELLELQPKAIQNLNQTIMKDPPPEAGSRDLAAAEDVHELALGSVQRLMDWHRRNPGITF